MSKRGVSAADKRTRVLDILHESQDFFVLKELEKLAGKKGVVPQSVKEVLQELKDDRLIEVEKRMRRADRDEQLAYQDYWSFPYTATAAKQATLAAKTAELASVDASRTQLEIDVKAAGVGRESTDDRAALLAHRSALLAEASALSTELSAYGLADPAAHEAKLRAIDVARAEATRHTENTLVVLQYVKAQTGLTDAEVREQFGISATWEDGYC